jgi:hypothetical protein
MKTYGGVKVELQASSPWNWMELGGCINVPATLFPEKEQPVTIGYEAGWPSVSL